MKNRGEDNLVFLLIFRRVDQLPTPEGLPGRNTVLICAHEKITEGENGNKYQLKGNRPEFGR